MYSFWQWSKLTYEYSETRDNTTLKCMEIWWITLCKYWLEQQAENLEMEKICAHNILMQIWKFKIRITTGNKTNEIIL